MRNIIVISRAHKYSPNSVERDAAILDEVTRVLQQRGFKVSRYEETHIPPLAPTDIVLSMARSHTALLELAKAEKAGTRIYNKPSSLINATRENLATLMLRQHIDVPQYESFVPHNCDDLPALDFPIWIKQCGTNSLKENDVRYIGNIEEWRIALKTYIETATRELFLNEHIAGDLIKFYGVKDSPFFFWYYATAEGKFSKFGWENHNGGPQRFPFDEPLFQQMAHKAAEVCHIDIFGGDAIVTKEGRIYIIDFNDFPSFSSCRKDAALAISEHLLRSLKNQTKQI